MKAIIPAAGNGVRMRAITNSGPKELLEINGYPLIHHAVLECVISEINEIIIVIKKDKKSIIEYFQKLKLTNIVNPDLLTNKIRNNEVNINFIIQEESNGSGGAVLAARELIKEEDLIVIFPDVYVQSERPNILEMLDLLEKYDCSIISVDSIDRNEIDRYGVTITTDKNDDYYIIEDILEKPSFKLGDEFYHGIIGRYVLKNEIFNILEKIGKNIKNEIDLSQGLITLEKKVAKVIKGRHFECGSISPYKESLKYISEKGSHK